MINPLLMLDSTEQITPELKLEWYCGRRIVAYTLSNVSQATVDAFVEAIATTEKQYAPDDYRLTLVDVSHPSIALTPYARRKVEEMNRSYGYVKGRTALIIRSSFMGRALQFTLLVLWRRRQDQIQVFFSREKGFQWLLEALPIAA